MNKQVRIYVNGAFQFPLTVPHEASLADVAARAHKSMRLSENFIPKFGPGLVNFIVP